jgi:hypothetical protein
VSTVAVSTYPAPRSLGLATPPRFPPPGSSPEHRWGVGGERVLGGIDDDPLTIGRRLRQIRRARGKSLRVVAGLAGMSKSHLDRIERGERALDSRA